MKRISAVICELNPLHEGHKYILSVAKEKSDILIAVMSGNFVQRGETAVYDKYKRARSALSAGADLVIELPFPYSASSAEFFAKAGVRIAECVGVNTLYFGSECGDINALRSAGKILSSKEYKDAMTVGRSAALRSEILKKLAPHLPDSLLSSPNDILGCEYCRNATADTVAVKRISTDSASAIREANIGKDGSDMLDPRVLFDLEYKHFRTSRKSEAIYAECTGGVYERLYNKAFETSSFKNWIEDVKTKQYTNSRLRRAALFALCSVTPKELCAPVLFTRVLGANAKGRQYLNSIRKGCDFPILTNASDKRNLSDEVLLQVELSEYADSIYALCAGAKDPAVFIKTPPVMVE